MVENRCRAGFLGNLLSWLQLKPETMPGQKRNHQLLMSILTDPCCLLLIAVGVLALMIKLIKWFNHWLK